MRNVLSKFMLWNCAQEIFNIHNNRYIRPELRAGECKKCFYLLALYESTSKKPRDYWVMTELFVMLHGGDVCNEGTQIDGH